MRHAFWITWVLTLIIRVCASVYATEPISVKDLVHQSQEAAAKDDWQKAEHWARQAIAADAAYGPAWRQLGQLLARAGRRKDAMEALQTAVQLSPDDASAWRELGWLLWAEGQRDQALTAWNRAFSAGLPNPGDLALQILAALAEQGRAEEGWKLFRKWAPGESVLRVGMALVDRGRIVAARPLLEKAWAANEKPPMSGLYLAYANAVNGSCASAGELLAPFIAQVDANTEAHLVDMALETLHTCPSVPQLQQYVVQLEAASISRGQSTKRITEILERAAEDQRVHGHAQRALELYSRVLQRDADRTSWIVAARLAEELNGPPAAYALMQSVLSAATSIAVRTGIQATLARKADQWQDSVALYAESLASDPNQPWLRQDYVDTLLAVGRVGDARAQAEWFAERVEKGDQILRSYLAELWERLGEYEKALDLWQILYLSQPNIPYYAVQAAGMMFRLCDARGALDLLHTVIADHAYPQAYELIAEIYSTLGRPVDAVEQAALGVATTTPTLGLLRQHAENADAAGLISTSSLASSQAFLAKDPTRANMAELHGHQLWVLEMTNEAVIFHESLAARNPAFLPSRVFLKDAYSARREFEKAVKQSTALVELLPRSVDLARRHALALAEYERWRRALKTLRRAADQEASQTIPVLIYRIRHNCDYPARNSVAQVREHIRRLREEGYNFVGLDEINNPPVRPAVLLIFLDLSERVAAAIDEILAEHEARAVYAGTPRALKGEQPGGITRQMIEEMQASRRWMWASSGPDDVSSVRISESGLTGNALTHRIWKREGRESLEEYRQRVGKLLTLCADSLPKGQSKWLVYPNGDFGQLSLDTGLEEIVALKELVAERFAGAFYFEDPGFVPPQHEHVRLPGRLVPGDWDGEQLMNHMRRRNPITRAYLDLAKLLYWNRQHEAANVWFERAAAAGADAWEVSHNWGANAYQQGDLKTSREKLRIAAEIDPQSEKTRMALKRTEEDRRPEVRLFMHGWDDNENRLYRKWGGEAHIYAGEALRLGAFVDRNRWETEGVGEEHGTRPGLALRWYAARGVWFDARVWRLFMDDLPDRDGHWLSLRLPNRLLSGHVELIAAREEMETVEALRADIYQNRYAAQTYSRLLDVWDLFANLTRYERTDDNETTILDGRLVYRLKEWPFLGLGYAFRFGDSHFDPPEYWAPEELEQHQVYGTWRGVSGPVNHQFSAQAGYAREMETEWKFVWGARGAADIRLNRVLSIRGEVSYFEGPIYRRTTWTASLVGRF